MDERQARIEALKTGREFQQIWRELLAAFPAFKPSDRTLEVYTERLADITPTSRLRAAAEQCMATCKFFPAIAEIREAAGAVKADRSDVAADVYGATVKELSRALAVGEVPRLEPLVREIVAGLGGAWSVVYSQQPDTTRAHFLQAYREKAGQEATISNVVPMARRLAPGPAPREIGFAPRAELPAAPPEPPLSREEAADFIAAIRKVPVAKLPPAPGSDVARRETPAAETPLERIDFSRCGECGLEYPGEGRGCPRCSLLRQMRDAGATL